MYGLPAPLSLPTPLQGFNWTLFIQNVLSSVEVELFPDEEVVVYGIPYLENLEDIIDSYSAR
jgi:membrane metallo-endopeptidase-like protein 1